MSNIRVRPNPDFDNTRGIDARKGAAEPMPPRRTVMPTSIFDTLATVTAKGYGINTAHGRYKIQRANPNWTPGKDIHVPH